MNVLLLTHRLPYAPNRGDRIRAFHLLRALSTFADVALFSLVHDEEEERLAATVTGARMVVTARVPRTGTRVRAALQLFSRRPLTHALLDAPDAHARLQTLVDEWRPDLVVAYCSGMARFALEPPLDGIPFVLDMVDVDSAKWRQLAAVTRGPLGWVYRREAGTLAAFERRAVGRAAATLVVNARERQVLDEVAPGARVQVVENGIDVDAYRAAEGIERTPTVVFCGVLDYAPNENGVLWFLDTVWPLVHATRPDARFAIVGANPTPPLRRAAARFDSVDLIGPVPAVQPYLWRASVSVAPLLLARGLQNKVLEALAAGLPVVATPAVIDGLPASARAACLSAGEPADFAMCVLQLLNDPPEARAARVGRVDLSALRWPERLARVETILRGAAGELVRRRA
jgi:sugar transferase (PEP-CTERM/EpsH1 system associated)